LEHLVEFIQVFHLEGEVDLLDERALQGSLAHRHLHSRGEEGSEIAEEEEEVDVPLDVLVHIGVSHLYSHLLPLVLRAVHLTHRP
jgi:hypothetical protein